MGKLFLGDLRKLQDFYLRRRSQTQLAPLLLWGGKWRLRAESQNGPQQRKPDAVERQLASHLRSKLSLALALVNCAISSTQPASSEIFRSSSRGRMLMPIARTISPAPTRKLGCVSFLLASCFLLLASCFLLLASCFFLLTSYFFLLLSTFFLILSSFFFLLFSFCFPLSSSFRLLSSVFLANESALQRKKRAEGFLSITEIPTWYHSLATVLFFRRLYNLNDGSVQRFYNLRQNRVGC